VQKLLHDKYGLTDVVLTKMEGYNSDNFKVEAGELIYVLKKYRYSAESSELLKAENNILQELGVMNSLEFPKVFKSYDKELVVKDGHHLYRLLSYIEGEFLGNVEHKPILLQSFGRFLGKMDNSIYDTYHASINAKKTQWDLQFLQKNYRYLEYIPDVKDRNLVDYFFLQFDEQIYPIQHKLRKGVIHNDANDWNVLTRDGKVSGIIDFGDMCHTWVINEIAVAITYVMMEKDNPLEIASEVIKGYCEVFPLEEIELSVLYYLVAGRLCTSVCNSSYTKTLKPNSEYITISERPAWNLLRKWLTINPVLAENTFRLAAGFREIEKMSLNSKLEKRKEHLGEALALSYKKPIQMQRSAFQYMYDTDGNTLLDAYNNIMLAGHCHPSVVRAGQKALAKLNTNTRYLYDELQEYARKLLSKFPSKLNKVFFVNSGSAAGDLALRMAIQYSQKEKILVLENGYHGNTNLTIDASHYKYANSKGSGQKDFVLETPMPKVFNSGLKDDGTAGIYFAKIASKVINENIGKIAAFIAEPIIGCGGQIPLASGYLKEVYMKIRAQGGICISDEVQVGFGRLGDYFWGFEMHEVVPDIVIIGKPMGNGHPIGAVVTTEEISASFDKGPEFFSSFGGNPVSCAIGKAVLQVIDEENLQEHAKKVGDYFIEQLKMLQKSHPELADIRGSGLFLGVEILTPNREPATSLASDIKNFMRANNILISTDGPFDNVLKIKPPLSFAIQDVDIFITVLEKFFVV